MASYLLNGTSTWVRSAIEQQEPRVVTWYHDPLANTYVEVLSDGTRRVSRNFDTMLGELALRTYAPGKILGPNALVATPPVAAPKSAEEIMDDAIDAAVRAARGAV